MIVETRGQQKSERYRERRRTMVAGIKYQSLSRQPDISIRPEAGSHATESASNLSSAHVLSFLICYLLQVCCGAFRPCICPESATIDASCHQLGRPPLCVISGSRVISPGGQQNQRVIRTKDDRNQARLAKRPSIATCYKLLIVNTDILEDGHT